MMLVGTKHAIGDYTSEGCNVILVEDAMSAWDALLGDDAG